MGDRADLEERQRRTPAGVGRARRSSAAADYLPLGRGKRARRAYGFDEVALVPGRVTINPEEIDISTEIGGHRLEIPILASAMDGSVDVEFAIAMGRLGGLAVLNLDGVQTRYEDPSEVLHRIADAAPDEINVLIQKIYQAPVKDELIQRRIQEIKAAGVLTAVSTIPQRAAQRAPLIAEAGADLIFVQGTVLTARHVSRAYKQLSFRELTRDSAVPIVVGNCVHYETALELMETGIAGILVGVGPGAACTTRGVLGVGVPQVTATADVAAARNDYHQRTGRWVPVITDGGMRIGADVCKAFASGRRRGDDRHASSPPPPRPPGTATTGAWRRPTPTFRAAPASTSAPGPRSPRSWSARPTSTTGRRT